ncbi:MAG: hypothetical protein Q7Q73_05150 [Verrucomicrobiota bacterium JB024]|nr:hypothetical protein [Verrucomicrobiota bacterium JB024]
MPHALETEQSQAESAWDLRAVSWFLGGLFLFFMPLSLLFSLLLLVIVHWTNFYLLLGEYVCATVVVLSGVNHVRYRVYALLVIVIIPLVPVACLFLWPVPLF